MKIERYNDEQQDSIVQLSLRAWEPVFESVRAAMGPDIFDPQVGDWRVMQANAVMGVCDDPDVEVWVASEGRRPVGFTALRLHETDHMGEVYMIAVDPDHQRRGIASALIEQSLASFRQAGMTTAMVETGGDPGHAPARRAYESAGFRLFPVSRYFIKL